MKTLDDYKNELVNKTFKWLTVLDVYRINGKRKCLCRCQCGNVCEKDLVKVISGHTKSCGCLKSSQETSDKISQWYKDHPDKVKEKSDSFSQWCKENSDKTAEWGKKYSDWCKENPEKVKDRNRAVSDYYKNNPDKAKERAALRLLNPHYTEFLKDKREATLNKYKHIYIGKTFGFLTVIDVLNINNKYVFRCQCKCGIIKNISKKYILSGSVKSCGCYVKSKEFSTYKIAFWRDNPEILKRRGNAYSNWCKLNKDKSIAYAKKISILTKRHYKNIRSNKDYSNLIHIVHPDYIKPLLNGEIGSADYIFTKCPICSSYDKHSLHNVFVLSTCKLKRNTPPLCSKCRNQLSSSSYESEIYDFITSLGYSCVRNTREIISPLELDLYIPDKHLAIEFNGNYWHSELYKDKDYHYNKFKLCRERGINLISIFESEWIFDSNVIKNYIKDYLNGIENALSFNEDHSIMNNNYPSPKEYMLGEFVENYYNKENYKVYTCGFSKIME